MPDHPAAIRRIPYRKGSDVITLGVILLVIGLVAGIGILTTVGVILLVIGAILTLLGAMGNAVGGRKTWY